jgi:hypothetical protein
METLIFDLIKIIFTVGLLMAASMYILRTYQKPSRLVTNTPSANENQRIILTLRLQAYERLVLYLERISPDNLIVRLNDPELTAFQFQTLLVKTIRDEFEYNLSQQLYISSRAWELVKNAKEETINMINQATSQLPAGATSAELIRLLFGKYLEKEKHPVNIALDEVKREIQTMF